MRVPRSRVALNAIQWINVKEDPDDPDSADLWRFADPDFRADYPQVLDEIRRAGFGAVMMEVLATQTLQDFRRMIEASGLELAPGYAAIGIPSDHAAVLAPGTAERVHWFDGIRRKAEESAFAGLSTIFLAPEMSWGPAAARTAEVAVGAQFSQQRLDEQIEIIAEACEVLAAEGVRAGLHNHVGTWIETEDEIEQTLAAVPARLLGASFDVGHLEWAGIDATAMIRRHAERIVDLHVKDLDLEVAASSRATPTTYRSATDRGLFLEPGLGGLDLAGMLAELPADFGGWVIVEVDRASVAPLRSAEISWDWAVQTFPDTPVTAPAGGSR